METFGERLKMARTNKNMLQAPVAEKLGCAATSLTNWERDKIQPPMEMLEQLCEIYEISPLDLLEKEYDYDDLMEITKKPISDRTYEERIALTFALPILEKIYHITGEKRIEAETQKKVAFMERISSSTRLKIKEYTDELTPLMNDYEKNGRVDEDILFLYHVLNKDAKQMLLSMLYGLCSETSHMEDHYDEGVLQYAADYTAGRLMYMRDRLRDE